MRRNKNITRQGREFARTLKRLRAERGLTLRDVAAACGIVASTFSCYERGEGFPDSHLPSPRVLKKLIAVFPELAKFEGVVLNERKVRWGNTPETAARINAVKKSLGLTHRALARRADVNPTVVFRTLRGDADLTVASMRRILAALNMTEAEARGISESEEGEAQR